MTISAIKGKKGTKYRVGWKENGQRKYQTLPTLREAQRLNAEKRRLADQGYLGIGAQTLAAFEKEWWPLYAQQLAPATQDSYASVLDVHVLPTLGSRTLSQLWEDPSILDQWLLGLESGKKPVGPAARRKAIAVLQSVLRRAVQMRRIPGNPAALLDKPSGRSVRVAQPPSVDSVEKIRKALRGRYMASDGARDATLVGALAYAGLRPGEALALTWGDIGERTIRVTKSMQANGETKDTKTRAYRSVRLIPPLRADLLALKLQAAHVGDGDLIFGRLQNGQWRHLNWHNWSQRIYNPVARACGLVSPRPYDLRHACASLLIQQGMSVVEVAAQMGHSSQMTLGIYAHVFSEADPGDRRSIEERLRDLARADDPLEDLDVGHPKGDVSRTCLTLVTGASFTNWSKGGTVER